MSRTIFVTGGCRSGKSSHALELAEKISEHDKIFIATCIPHDNEMQQRITAHKKERCESWQTLEIPLSIADAITKNSKNAGVILVDCITLWLSNLLLENFDQEAVEKHVDKLSKALEKSKCPVVLVSNEVGAGIVPENKLARLFRDTAGFANQKIAECADRVIWMVAGIPVVIKQQYGGK